MVENRVGPTVRVVGGRLKVRQARVHTDMPGMNVVRIDIKQPRHIVLDSLEAVMYFKFDSIKT